MLLKLINNCKLKGLPSLTPSKCVAVQISDEQDDVCVSRPVQDLRGCPDGTIHNLFLVFVQSTLQSLQSDQADQRAGSAKLYKSKIEHICKI